MYTAYVCMTTLGKGKLSGAHYRQRLIKLKSNELWNRNPFPLLISRLRKVLGPQTNNNNNTQRWPPHRPRKNKLFSFRLLPFTFPRPPNSYAWLGIWIVFSHFAREFLAQKVYILLTIKKTTTLTFSTWNDGLISVNIFMAALAIWLAQIKSDKFNWICNIDWLPMMIGFSCDRDCLFLSVPHVFFPLFFCGVQIKRTDIRH